MTPIWHFVNGVPNTGPMVIGPLAIGPAAVTSTVPFVGPAGTISDTAFNFGVPGTGLYGPASGVIAFANIGQDDFVITNTEIRISSTQLFGWTSGGAYTNGLDATLSRGAAGRIDTTKAFRMTPVAFAALPTAAEGAIASVNDSNTATWGASIAGGGANKVLAYYNGTAWKVAAA